MRTIVMLVLLVGVGGCSGSLIKKGDLLVISGSLISKKDIAKLELEGFGKMEGFASDPSIEAMRAVAEGAAAGAVKAAKP